MATVNLSMPDVDVNFARIVKQLHAVYAKRIRCGCEINFSGNISDVKLKFHSIDPMEIYDIVQEEKEKELIFNAKL